MVVPLYKAAENKDKFVFGEEFLISFERFKRALTTTPVLILPESCGKCISDCVASDSGIGVMLSQDQKGEEKAIA